MADVVKVDKELMKKVDEFIKKEKYRYSSKKQVVNLAIIEFLKSFHQEHKFLNAVRNQDRRRFLKSYKENQNRRIKKKQNINNKKKRRKGGGK